MDGGALAGIRVLEFSQIVAGPFAGVALSDMGADVIKVEALEGEGRRNSAAVVPNEGKYFQSLNRGKRSLTMDLSRPEARALVARIVPRIDVVLVNYRVGAPARMGIDYATLAAINPRLVYASITGFGDRGPFAKRAGSDIVAQAYSGLMAAEAKVDDAGAPAPITGSTFIDRSSGLAAAMGICAALFHRERTGQGQELHVSLLQTALELQSNQVMREPVHDVVLRDPLLGQLQSLRASGARYEEMAALRRGEGMRFASHRLFYGGYNTGEGALVLGALTRQNRDAIRAILDVHDETDSPAFDGNDPANRPRVDAWRAEIQQRLLARGADEWVEQFLAAGVPASVVNFAEEMSDDPQVESMGMMADLVHEVTGPQRVVGPLVRMSASPTRAQRAAPVLGWDSAEVLEGLGIPAEEVAALQASGVIGSRR